MIEVPSKIAVGLPATLVVCCHYPLMPMGAVLPSGFDISRATPGPYILMHQVWYTTPKRIHGLLHGYVPPHLMFVGYECGACHEVFLVPDSVTNESELGGRNAPWLHGGATSSMIPLKSTYDCPVCDQVCPSLAQYLSHYEKAHGRGSATISNESYTFSDLSAAVADDQRDHSYRFESATHQRRV